MKLSNQTKCQVSMSLFVAFVASLFFLTALSTSNSAFANDQRVADAHRLQQERQANRARIVADRTRLMDQKHLAPQAGNSVFAEHTTYQHTLDEYFTHESPTFASMFNHGLFGRLHFSSKRSDAYLEQGPLWNDASDAVKTRASIFAINLKKVMQLGNKDPQRGSDLVSHKENPLFSVVLNYIHNAAEGEERGVQIINQRGTIWVYKKDSTGLHLFKGRSLEEAIQVAFEDELFDLAMAASLIQNQVEGNGNVPSDEGCNGAMPGENLQDPFEHLFGDIDNKHIVR